ncbi:MAG: NAD+ synthase [Mariprofundaceae bacterium]|nr:NAD+ synthase [Mariprofundaceae bacterium]
MKIMLAQLNSKVGDIQGNCQRILTQMQHAQQQACDVIVFPELALTGYPPEDLLLRKSFMDVVDQALLKITSASTQCICILGHPRREDSLLYNSASLLSNGQCIDTYDKQALPNYGVFDEQRYFSKGSSAKTFTVHGWHIGISICEDLWNDDVARQQQSCDMVFSLNASPFHLGKQQEREKLLQARARQWNSPICYINMVGGQDEVVFDGGSCVIDSEGDLMSRLAIFVEDDAFYSMQQLEPHPQASIPSELEGMHKALIMGIHDYVRLNHGQQVLLGLSGGIDSALTAVLAVQALGAENVLGVLMPSAFSSDHSIHDAEDLARHLNIETTTLAIAEPVEMVEKTLKPSFEKWQKTTSDVTEENIQARMRALLLMAISNKTGRMLLTTGNKSEMAVGYATLYGDMAGGFAPLKDVYKTQVFALSRHINHKHEIIPWNTIEKPPSAELRPDQFDSDNLPNYDDLDAILQASIEDRLSSEEISRHLNIPLTEVQRIVHLLYLAEYKRRQAPPGIKITSRSFGRERRYPITHQFRD